MFGVYNNSIPQSHSPHHRSHASHLAGYWTSSFLSLHVYDPKSFCYNEDFNKFQLIFYCFWDRVSSEAQLVQICGDPPDPHLPGPEVPSVSLYGHLLTSWSTAFYKMIKCQIAHMVQHPRVYSCECVPLFARCPQNSSIFLDQTLRLWSRKPYDSSPNSLRAGSSLSTFC